MLVLARVLHKLQENLASLLPARFFSISGLSMTLVFGVVVLRGWIHPLPSGLWLDEMGTHYIVSGSWNDFLDRMARAIQSPFYCTFLWAWVKVAGLSEVALRLPSVLALGATGFLVYRLAARMVDKPTGLLAVLAFFSAPPVMRLGIQARPYTVGMLAATMTMMLLLNWLTARTRNCAILCGLSVALLLYIQPLNFTLAMAVFGIVAFCHVHRHNIPLSQILLFVAVVTVSVAPIVPYYWGAARESEAYSFAGRPAFGDLAQVYSGSLLPGCLLLGLMIAYGVFGSLSLAKVEIHPMSLLVLTFWVASPPLLLFAYSRLASGIFVERYYSCALPAVAIITALVVRHLDRAPVRMCVICSLALGGVLTVWSTAAHPSFSDWREAAEVLRTQNYDSDTPILVRSGFVEATRIRRLTDPKYREFILAPMHVYPVRGSVYALPDSPDDQVGQYTEQLIGKTVEKKNRFFLFGRGPWVAWFERRFSGGWKEHRLHSLITEFSRENVTLGKKR